MAIFGTFEEIPPQEALTTISNRTGIFTARLLAGIVFELDVEAGTLLGFTQNGQPLPDVLSVRDRFAQLLSARKGEFDFRRSAHLPSRRRFHLPIDQLVVSAMAYSQDLRQAGAELPSEYTRFVSTGREELWLGEDLAQFWEKARPFFKAGASAQDLSRWTALALPQVQWFLYRLRTAGLIRPRRSAGPMQEPEALLPLSVSTSARPSPPPDLRRLKIDRPPARLLHRLMRGLASVFG